MPEIKESEVIASITRESFQDFVREFWDTVVPEPLEWNWHMGVLCDEMQIVAERVFDDEPKVYDLIINVPPGTSKSTICSILFPAWVWTRMPSARSLCGSYAYPLAMELSRKSRMVVNSDLYLECFPEVKLLEDQNTKGSFADTRGGIRYAFGVGGSVTGMHGHFIIVDDPLDPNRAVSELELASTNHWMGETLSQRKVKKTVTPTILIMQRLAQDDPTGNRLTKKDSGKIRHICLPAEVSDNVKPERYKSGYVNGLLDPNRLSRDVLREARSNLGEYGYACQFDQTPIPRGGGMFMTERIQICDVVPKIFRRRCRFWDKAGSHGKGAFTVGFDMGLDMDGVLWILDIIRGRWDSGKREKIVKRTAKIDGKSIIVGLEQEPGSGGKESAEKTVQMLMGWRCVVLKPTGDKVLRADPFSVQVNNGNVRMKRAYWNKEFLDEAKYFPYSKYKDQVDAGSGCFSVISSPRMRAGAL